MTTQNARMIAADVQAGRTSAETVAHTALARIAAYDPIQPQTWISRLEPDQVLAQAIAVDRRVATGECLPLAGVPFAVKDNIDVAGLPTTAACPAFAYEPGASSAVVARLQAAGAVVVGKTNLDQFATGLVGVRSPHGAPGCVFNRAYISGGSSSGSAVAVAAGLVPFALGTDTAGSGRVPAAFNGLVGFKPTKGRWSSRGLVPACRSLDCVTVLAADAADAALVDSVAAGFDSEDPYSRHEPPDAPGFPAPFRFGAPLPEQRKFLGDAQSAALFEGAIKRLAAAGGTPVDIDISPLLDAARLLYSGPWVAERTAAVEGLLRANPSAVHPVVRAILQGGFGVSGVDAFRGLYALQGHMRAAEAIWRTVDVLLTPTVPTIYRIAEVLAEPEALNGNLGLYTNFVNLLDMSAVAVPAGWRDNATGFGVTLIGPAWADRALLDLAARYEAAGPAQQAPPPDVGPRPEVVRLAVVGAHLHGMPLHWQLTSRFARLAASTTTAPVYRLYALSDSVPPKPALVHVGSDGRSIQVEVYELPVEGFGSFVDEVPAPLAVGSVTLSSGEVVKGFVAEPRALAGAQDITHLGGWRAYVADC
ncbi:MAG TPA: allophanate hydrolase [Caulobacteraceae bacterium]|nr:allophanate hydrolase [Caulobacteraceae bacterium]